MLPEVESFFKTMYNENNLTLSFVVDKAVFLEQSKMGTYDHIVITDRSWIDSFEIGIEEQGKSGQLTSKDFDSLPRELSDFLKAQLPVWTKNGEAQPEGIKFYEYTGGEFLAISLDGETVQAKNPLVILVDNPIETFKVDGFLLPLTSSGNVIFPNDVKLQSALSDSPLKPYVTSIDGIADYALEMAQGFQQQSVYYVVACILILVALFFTGILSGKLWAGMNKKRIFTLHTFGVSYNSIIKPVLKSEFFTAIITTLVGTILSYMIHHMELNILIPVALVVLLLYFLGSLFAYKLYTRQTFHLASQRHD